MSSQKHKKFLDRSTPPHILTLIMLSAISALSMTLFLPSLPNMTAYFETDYRLMQLSVAVYLVMNAVINVVVGPISDHVGRRSVTLCSLVIFLAATIGCVLSPNVEVFLAFRMIQAVVATSMVISRAIARDMYSDSQAASVIGYITMGMAVAPMIGPVIGGFLDQLIGWHASFVFLTILGAVVLLISYFDLGETSKSRPGGISQQLREYPELFRSRRFWAYCLIAGFASGMFFAYLGGAPFVGTEIFGLTSSVIGFYFGLTAFGYMGGNFLSARYSTRFGINRMVLWGTCLCVISPVGPIVLGYLGSTHPLSFFGFAGLMGVGNGLVLPNATAGMLSVRPHLAGSASGIGGALMIGAGSILSALAGSLLSSDSGPYPLYFIMLFCAVTSACLAVRVTLLARKLARSGSISG